MPKTVGVLGGMGPYATAAFFKTLLDLTPAQRDWEHLRVVIDNHPHIPSRTRHLLYGEASPVPGMLAACRQLERYPVDFIAVPCNSAAYFLPELQKDLTVPFLNIIEVTAAALADRAPQAKAVAVLGGHVTYATRSYAPFLAAQGVDLIDHGAELQAEAERQIEALKLGRAGADEIRDAATLAGRLQRDFGADAIVFACTEFGCLPPLEVDLPILDSSLELARRTVSLGRA